MVQMGKANSHTRNGPAVTEAYLLLYMQSVADLTDQKLLNVMTWVHAIGDCHSATLSRQHYIQGLQKSLVKLVVNKLPVTVEMMAMAEVIMYAQYFVHYSIPCKLFCLL